MKRLIDFLLALICLIIFSPLFLLKYYFWKLDGIHRAFALEKRIRPFRHPCIWSFQNFISQKPNDIL